MFLIHAAPLTVTANSIDIRHNYYYRPFTSIKPQILFFIRCVIHQCIYGTEYIRHYTFQISTHYFFVVASHTHYFRHQVTSLIIAQIINGT